MLRLQRLLATAIVAVGMAPLAWAQFPSEVVGFNAAPIDNPDDAATLEMFLFPQASGTTDEFVVANTSGADNNFAARISGFQISPPAALGVFFRWVDTMDPDAWLRLTTFNGNLLPNPALHTQGRVRMNLFHLGDISLFTGEVGLCIGIRETGAEVPQLGNGGTSGDIEWVGVDTTPNGITAGADGIVDTAATGDDVQAVGLGEDINLLGLPAGTAVVEPGLNGVLDTAPSGDDQIRSGYTIGANGEPRPIPAITIPPFPAFVEVEWDLSTGNVFVDDVNMGGGIAPFTGNGVLDAANNRGTLEHLAIVNLASDTGVSIDMRIDDLQFEAPVADPVLPPTVVAPIIAGDMTVTVTDLLPPVDQVQLLRNGAVILTEDVVNNDDLVFNLPAAAVTGDEYTATQRSGDTGTVSNESDPVVVLAEPSPYLFSFLLDEDGNGCSFQPPGGWEFVGATSRVNGPGILIFPQGVQLFPNSAVWQTIDISLTDPNIVTSWLGGDGDVDPPTPPATDYAMDTIWFTRAPGAGNGPYEILLDAVETVDAGGGGTVLSSIFDFESGTPALVSSRGQSSSEATLSEDTTDASFDGNTSRRLVWEFTGDPNAALGQLTRQAFNQCTTTWAWLAQGDTIRFHMVLRATAPNALPLPVVEGPVLLADGNVTVTADGTATAVTLYVNGVQEGAPQAPAGGQAVFAVALTAGDSVSATQTIGAEESDFAYPKTAMDIIPPPSSPTLPAPIQVGDNSITVTAVVSTATQVDIVDAGDAVIGSTMTINPDATAEVTLTRALVPGEVIRGRSINASGSADSEPFEVGGGNGDLLISLGIRETGDAGPLGSEGGTAGPIEWLGAGSTDGGGAPVGKSVAISDSWQTVVFDPSSDPATGFTGDGVINGTRGTLEHLAITVDSASMDASTGTYQIFIDNVINVGADVGGADFVIADFEAQAVGTETLFQEPTFSGSTDGNLYPLPSASEVSAAQGNPGQSEILVCFFRDTAEGRWARVTTSGATELSRPIVSLVDPIQLDILLAPLDAGGLPGDMNCDGSVSVGDINPFVLALTDPVGYAAAFPDCDINNGDCSGDGNVSVGDINCFVALVVGG